MDQQQFPKDVRVSSPEIDSIQRTTERISNWLHNDLKEVIKPLQVLPRLPKILEDLKVRLVEQFQHQFSGRVALDMKAREANIRVVKRKADVTQRQIESRRQRLQTRAADLAQLYGRRAERSAAEHSNFLKRLDGHAYKLVEDVYPNRIQAKFSFASTPFWQGLARHASASAVARTGCLEDAYGPARAAVAEFDRNRAEAVATLESHTVGEHLGEGDYEIPYWYVELEDAETGEVTYDVVFPWDVSEQSLPASPEQLQSIRARARAVVRKSREAGNEPETEMDEESYEELRRRAIEGYDLNEAALRELDAERPRVVIAR